MDRWIMKSRWLYEDGCEVEWYST